MLRDKYRIPIKLQANKKIKSEAQHVFSLAPHCLKNILVGKSSINNQICLKNKP